MQTPEPRTRPEDRGREETAELTIGPGHESDAETQIRHLQERLAFYEGFDELIQESVAHARELFRQAAREREAAAERVSLVRQEAEGREAALRSELEAVAADLSALAAAVEGLAQRVARVLSDAEPVNGHLPALAKAGQAQPMAIVVHGVPSARTALSLQRFVGTLPQVSDVSAREFAGGVLRLDARVWQRLEAGQFGGWDGARRIEVLTDLPDVVEFAVRDAAIVLDPV